MKVKANFLALLEKSTKYAQITDFAYTSSACLWLEVWLIAGV